MASVPDLPWLQGIEGRTALVTGAGRGIGRACALALARAGARVIGVARTADDLETLEREACGDLQGWIGDVTTESLAERVESLARLDILVSNAGMNRPLPMEAVDAATLDSMLLLNVRSVYRISQAAARVMAGRTGSGSIIHMSSQMGHVGAELRTVYCMTKHAVEGLTKSMAIEFAARQIRVNSVAPTFVSTELTRPMLEDDAFQASVRARIPLGRIGTPDDVVGAVLFLASSASSLVTGTSLRVDGGWTAR